LKSTKLIGGIVAGSVVGATVGYMMRPRNKAMSMMRKGMKMIKF
jgi:gas vesicle protein